MCFEHWVPSIQGLMFDKCDGTDEQRELLLHIALAYHAFIKGFPGVEPTDYFHFARRLVEVTLATEPDEDVEDRIVDLVEWLHKCLPMVSGFRYRLGLVSPFPRLLGSCRTVGPEFGVRGSGRVRSLDGVPTEVRHGG